MEKIKAILKEKGQEHLLNFYNQINNQEKENLKKEILCIDFDIISNYKSYLSKQMPKKFEPISVLKMNEIKNKEDSFIQTGIEYLKNCKVGAVILAGGHGSRLGSPLPKGMINLGITKVIYLFEIHIQNLMKEVKKANAWIPLFIMTSCDNYNSIVSFFNEHNYFDYNKDFVFFYKQESLPAVDTNGKILMTDKHKLALSPNGNGGWFSSLINSNLYSKIEELKLEWFNVVSVDNPLQKIADPAFIGATILSNKKSASKVVSKVSKDEKVGVMCLKDNIPSVIEYTEMPDELIDLKDSNGEYLYNYGVILNYLFEINKLLEIYDKELSLHVAFKVIPYIDENANLITPEKPNAYKFETLILDLVEFVGDCLPYEVDRNKEFAPIKNKVGKDSLESSQILLKNNGYEI